MTARSGGSGPPWRVLPLEVDAPAALLDRGVALLDGLTADPVPTLRWYRSTSTAVVLGRGQAPLVAGHSPDVEVLTRFSGGGAVLMDPSLLALDVLLPTGHPWLDGDLGAVFPRVGRLWADALHDLGVDGATVHDGPATARRRGDARERLLAAVCYATLGRGEVLVGGRKIVGLAQRRRRPGALVQCGLLRRWDPAPLLAALGGDPGDPVVLGAAVGLDEVLAGVAAARNRVPGGRVDDQAVMRAVTARATAPGGEPCRTS